VITGFAALSLNYVTALCNNCVLNR